jgi:hypothetical protein
MCALLQTVQVLSRKLDSPVSVPVYGSQSAAVTAGSPAGETFLSGGDRCDNTMHEGVPAHIAQ